MFRDHPRSRGEYSPAFEVDCAALGSSPLSRGIRRRGGLRGCGGGIIPALAGNTRRNLETKSSARDHPRSRGEYPETSSKPGCQHGSSPLSRGIPGVDSADQIKNRIIPALAGNTGTRRSWSPESGDHPRSRGEYRAGIVRQRPVGGSSPLSRGIRERSHLLPSGFGIIPALAGNTVWSVNRCATVKDHPRSRGEYVPEGSIAR